MQKRRLFYALPVDLPLAEAWVARFDEAAQRCFGIQCATRLRRVPPEEWHLTLAFLGMTPEEALPELEAALASRLADCEPPRVTELCGGCFPERGAARVIWYGPRAESPEFAALESIAVAVRAEIETVLPGRLAAGEVFRPHWTAARVPEGVRGPSLEGRRAFDGERIAGDWRPSAVRLYESRNSSTGPRYRVLASHALGRADGSATIFEEGR